MVGGAEGAEEVAEIVAEVADARVTWLARFGAKRNEKEAPTELQWAPLFRFASRDLCE